jgi:hypothetical protein
MTLGNVAGSLRSRDVTGAWFLTALLNTGTLIHPGTAD